MTQTTGGIENEFRFVTNLSRFKTIRSITRISLVKTGLEVDSDNGRARSTGKNQSAG